MAAPTIISAKEGTAIGPDRRIQQTVILTYMVGSDGPFTLTTNQQELSDGTAMRKMQLFANTLAALPRG